MIQCDTCEFFERDQSGQPILHCDPFSNIKEAACLEKHQLCKLYTLAQSHQATLDMYRRLAPLQEKMMHHLERELDEAEDADSWKFDPGEGEEEDEDDPFRL